VAPAPTYAAGPSAVRDDAFRAPWATAASRIATGSWEPSGPHQTASTHVLRGPPRAATRLGRRRFHLLFSAARSARPSFGVLFLQPSAPGTAPESSPVSDRSLCFSGCESGNAATLRYAPASRLSSASPARRGTRTCSRGSLPQSESCSSGPSENSPPALSLRSTSY